MAGRYEAFEVEAVRSLPIPIVPIVRRVDAGVAGFLIEQGDRFRLEDVTRPGDRSGAFVMPHKMYAIELHEVFLLDGDLYRRGGAANLESRETHLEEEQMPETVHGNGATIEDAVADALSGVNANHVDGEILKIRFDHGGFRGGTEYRVEVRVT